jgi:UDP-GlcNAc:undecaprenyl-phosphate GlcNAc-1-phosphate transferase
MIFWAAIGVLLLSAVIAALATPLSMRVAVRLEMLDVPSRHKAHARPTPLLGGSAMFGAILGPALLILAVARMWASEGVPSWLYKSAESIARHVDGAAAKTPVALGILAAALVLHAVGLLDDRRHLGPWFKLLMQLLVAAFVVLVCNVRILSVAGAPVSIVVTILWLVTITNSFNFLDNMDGLAAGVAAICAATLLGAAAAMGQVFVTGLLCLVLGSLLGFLPYNFPPASTFMGDAGSLVIGFLLAVASCLTTYVHPGQTYYTYGIFVPLVVMAVPLYDTGSVIFIRLREGRNPMVGDRRHFSHRLVRRGMSRRKAVLTIYLCTTGTAVAASLLPRVTSDAAAALVFLQTAAMLLIIAMLETGDAKS